MHELLEVKDLNVNFKTRDGNIHAVNNVTFSLKNREVLGIVGESGSGKSQSVLAILRLLASNATVAGSVNFMGQNLNELSLKNLNKIRGNQISIIFQDPMTSLNPYLNIKSQMIEVLKLHKGLSHKNALTQAIEMLDFVKIPDAKNRINLYPHEFSGGMSQRVMIATALLCKPKLLIADEPTTALDVTVQAQILQILRELKHEFDMSIIMITHDMGVVANICDRVNVMYAGNLVETGSIDEIFYDAKHPYTKGLLNSIPSLESSEKELISIPGEPPNLALLGSGCTFQYRCSCVHNACRTGEIEVQKIAPGRIAKCNLDIKIGTDTDANNP